MDSPLARVILSLLGGYLIILLFLSVYDWIVAEYPRRPTQLPSSERIQHPFYHEEAVKALQRFSRLSKREKNSIIESLQSGLISMDQWLKHLDKSKLLIICIGELHKESTRKFLAEEFFAKFSFDVLLLEATPNRLERLNKRLDAGLEYFPLLDADILNVLRAVKDRNPDIKICGIEETDEQEKRHDSHSNSRDKAIAENFWNRFHPDKIHIILFGALHCTNESNWLFQNLRSYAHLPLKNQMLNVQALGEHQNGPLESFVFFLDEIGVEKNHFVIPDTNSLHPRIYELFQWLTQQILLKYRSLIVFRI